MLKAIAGMLHIPVHENPSPLYPEIQLQSNEPGVLEHVAALSQGEPEHSLLSGK